MDIDENISSVSVAFSVNSFECVFAAFVDRKIEIFKCDLRSLIAEIRTADETWTENIANFAMGEYYFM